MEQFLEFLKFIFSIRMLPYTLPVLVMLKYWLFFIFGVVRLEMLDGADACTDILAESAGEAALEAAADGGELIEGAGAAAPDEFLIDVIGEEPAVGVLASADLAADVMGTATERRRRKAKGSIFARVLRHLNFGQVPATILLSCMIIVYWLLGFLGLLWLPLEKAWSAYPFLSDFVRFLFVTAVTVAVSGYITRPLGKFFGMATIHSNVQLTGRQCRITSTVVDNDFGEAELTVDGAFLSIAVRAPVEIKGGEGRTAIITGFDKERNIYYVK